MRSHHIIAIATALVLGLGVKLYILSAPPVEAMVAAAKSSRMDVSKMHVSAMLPVQNVHDMTFVFADGD